MVARAGARVALTRFYIPFGMAVMGLYLACWWLGLLPWMAVEMYGAALTVAAAELGDRS